MRSKRALLTPKKGKQQKKSVNWKNIKMYNGDSLGGLNGTQSFLFSHSVERKWYLRGTSISRGSRQCPSTKANIRLRLLIRNNKSAASVTHRWIQQTHGEPKQNRPAPPESKRICGVEDHWNEIRNKTEETLKTLNSGRLAKDADALELPLKAACRALLCNCMFRVFPTCFDLHQPVKRPGFLL